MRRLSTLVLALTCLTAAAATRSTSRSSSSHTNSRSSSHASGTNSSSSPTAATASPSKAATSQAGATAAKGPSLADFHLGSPVIGSFSTEEAKGKGVVIEAWGVNCGPCIASLPHMQDLYTKNKDRVAFVGAECQGSDKAAIEATLQKAGVTYPIVSGFASCPIAIDGIPHAFVFDATGKLLFHGHPMSSDFEAAVKKAAATATAKPAGISKGA